MKRTTSGFTVVELLVVIVVIAILASITVVAYTGIQDRARVTKKEAEIGMFARKVQIYEINHGAWPGLSGMMPQPRREAILAELELGAMRQSIVLANEYTNFQPCQTSPMTRQHYCVLSDSVIWWHDIDGEWKETREGTTYTWSWGGNNFPNEGQVF